MLETNLSARESTFGNHEAARCPRRLRCAGLRFGQCATRQYGCLRRTYLRIEYHRRADIRRDTVGPAADPEPSRDLRPSVLAVQVADPQPQCLRGQMSGAASPGRSLPRRYLRLQELDVVLALESPSDLDNQRNVPWISHPLSPAVPLTTLVNAITL